MEYYNSNVGRPIFNLQTFLRGISKMNENVYPVVPDGIFGEDTKRSVESFQFAYGIPVTGEVDSGTWEIIVREYEKYEDYIAPVKGIKIILKDEIINPGDTHEALLIIQSMIVSLSKIFSNIDNVEITGIYDEKTRVAVIEIKELTGLEGEYIDKKFINELSDLYEHSVVYKKEFYPAVSENEEMTYEIIPDKNNSDEEMSSTNNEGNMTSENRVDSDNDKNGENVIVWKFF